MSRRGLKLITLALASGAIAVPAAQATSQQIKPGLSDFRAYAGEVSAPPTPSPGLSDFRPTTRPTVVPTTVVSTSRVDTGFDWAAAAIGGGAVAGAFLLLGGLAALAAKARRPGARFGRA